MTNILTLKELMTGPKAEWEPGIWAPARPEPPPGIRTRLRALWMVLTGKADVLVWPKKGDK